MKDMHKKTKAVASLGVFAALALLLSYVEFLLPPLFAAVPGVKIGLPNVIIILALYTVGLRGAIAVSLLRVILSSILFGNAMVFAYSIVGALFSILVMAALKKADIFSPIGVSVAGGVAHNLGQTVVAVILLDTPEIAYYMVILALTGIAAGAFVGLLGWLLMGRVPKDEI